MSPAQSPVSGSASPRFPRKVSVEDLNSGAANTIMEALGIRFISVGDDYLEASMPVDRRTHQIHGVLHGGASVVLAETLGSVGATLMVDPAHFRCMGLEVNANHLSSVRSGEVIGQARPVHVGRTTQVWEIRIRNADGKPICISRLTVAVVPVK